MGAIQPSESWNNHSFEEVEIYIKDQLNSKATAAQGTKADTALQLSEITSGEGNGTIAVRGHDVAVTGLGSAAYKEETAFATAAQGAKADKATTDIVNIKKDIKNLQAAAGGAAKLSVNTTWAELKGLRDNSQLVVGTWYRITDYQCTTTQGNTKSAGHVFDIIVRADSENKLNEEAYAAQHTGDAYFTGSNLSAWRLWYCLDNDTARFTWADSSANGKGVIYRMIDEWNNDAPYDFKNIQFNGVWEYWAYTFNWVNDNGDNSCEDLSISQQAHVNNEGGYSYTYGNIIKPCGADGNNHGFPFKLNACVFLNAESYDSGLYCGCYNNTFGSDCYNNVFKNSCYNNTFGNGCYSNTFDSDCYNNTFGHECYQNSFGEGCYSNSFGNSCHNNTFGNSGYSNTFGNNCYNNTFGNTYQNNTFGNDCRDNTFNNGCQCNAFGSFCRSNTFGSGCSNNSFGPYCQNNEFGSSCYYNSSGSRYQNNILGNNCQYNTFGNNCQYNAFGNNCQHNAFGNSCRYIKFAPDKKDETTKYNFYQSNHFGDSCQYILFKGIETAASKSQVQNYNFAQGLQGTSSKYLTIDGTRNRSYESKVAKNSTGAIKIYCEADSVQ